MKWIALLTFGSVGAVLFLIGAGWGLKRIALVRRGVEALGVIVESQATTTSSTELGRMTSVTSASTAYRPVVRYVTRDGRAFSVTGSTGDIGRAGFAVGDKVKVYYDSENPESAVLAEFSQLWLGPVIVTLMGFLFLVFGVGGFFLIQSSDAAFGPDFQKSLELPTRPGPKSS